MSIAIEEWADTTGYAIRGKGWNGGRGYRVAREKREGGLMSKMDGRGYS